MTSAHLSLQPVLASDFDDMLACASPRCGPAWSALGRFDPARARDRLAAGFAPPHMQHIVQDGQRIGFVTVHPRRGRRAAAGTPVPAPGHQGQGVGIAWVLRSVQAHARDAGRC
jgi:hypothetical protein